eukprot:1029153-Prorocentrum_minimum.AAC.1
MSAGAQAAVTTAGGERKEEDQFVSSGGGAAARGSAEASTATDADLPGAAGAAETPGAGPTQGQTAEAGRRGAPNSASSAVPTWAEFYEEVVEELFCAGQRAYQGEDRSVSPPLGSRRVSSEQGSNVGASEGASEG